MSWILNSSVGKPAMGARNHPGDVLLVQTLLHILAVEEGKPQLHPGPLDGLIVLEGTSSTVTAIERFQLGLGAAGTGLFRAGDSLWTALVASVKSTLQADRLGRPQRPGGQAFPLAVLPLQDWTQPPASFDAPRSHGRRHAGCDLWCPAGAWVYAVGDGIVTSGLYPFSKSTFALEIDHGAFLARYAQLLPVSPLLEGDRVVAGEKVGLAGVIAIDSVLASMLHFERYDKTESGPLTISAGSVCPFRRRNDLEDPTEMLNALAQHLPRTY